MKLYLMEKLCTCKRSPHAFEIQWGKKTHYPSTSHFIRSSLILPNLISLWNGFNPQAHISPQYWLKFDLIKPAYKLIMSARCSQMKYLAFHWSTTQNTLVQKWGEICFRKKTACQWWFPIPPWSFFNSISIYVDLLFNVKVFKLEECLFSAFLGHFSRRKEISELHEFNQYITANTIWLNLCWW